MIVRMKTKIEIANKILKWAELHKLKNKKISSVYRDIIIPFSEEAKCEYYTAWKGWELLRTFGRVKGKYREICVCSYSPIINEVNYVYTNKQLKDLVYRMKLELKYYHDLYWQHLGDNENVTEHVKKLKPATCRGCSIIEEAERVIGGVK